MTILLDAGPSERGWHTFEMAARCMRWYAWNKVANKKFVLSAPLVNGSLLHIGLAHYYQRMMVGPEREDEYYDPAASVHLLAQEEADKTDDRNERNLWLSAIGPITISVLEYIDHYQNRCSWKPIAVEQELRANIKRHDWGDARGSGVSPIFGTFLFTQRADLIIEDSHGFKWIVDHKSCYRITSKTLRQFTLSGQFLGYQMFGRKMYGRKFGGVIINRVKLSNPFEVDRSVIEPAPEAIEGFIQMLKQTESRIQRWKAFKNPLDYPPVFSDQVCYGKYGQCPAFELCRWGEEND